ncbi:MAG: ABC transporter substrate-binding protein [Proteobacteria bacterium]|nr:ABC transporter substrate-binding protein [Pseudomonadota bacterium]
MPTLRWLLISLFCFNTAAQAALTVTDSRGNTVTLETPAQRIITLSPHAAELVFAAGAGAQLIAVSEHSDAPPAVKTLPIIGSASALDLERIIALKPSLIVLPSYLSVAQQQKLRALRIALYIADAPTPEAIADDIEALGVLSGHETAARAAAQRYRAQLKDITARAASAQTQPFSPLPPRGGGCPEEPAPEALLIGGAGEGENENPPLQGGKIPSPSRGGLGRGWGNRDGVPFPPSPPTPLPQGERGAKRVAPPQECIRLNQNRAIRETTKPLPVFYQLWEPPLYTVGGGSLIDQAITRCGGRNIFSALAAPSPVVLREAIIDARPHVIIMGASEQDFARWKNDWQRWPHIPAVRDQAFIRIDPDLLHRPGPRFVEGMAALCCQISEVSKRSPDKRSAIRESSLSFCAAGSGVAASVARISEAPSGNKKTRLIAKSAKKRIERKEKSRLRV